MPALSQRQSHSMLTAPVGKKDVGLRDGRDMAFVSSFVARVREQGLASNPGKEYEKVVAIKSSNLASYLVLRRAPKSHAGSDVGKSSAGKTEYAIDSCVKISPRCTMLRQGSLAVHFEKPEAEANGPRSARLKGVLRAKGKSMGGVKTKVDIVTVRDWAQESATSVEGMWRMLDAAAQRNATRVREDNILPAPHLRRRITEGCVDVETRMKVRNRSWPTPQVVANGTTASSARSSQGRKLRQAVQRGAAQGGGRYSALGRGAHGEASFAKSLVGRPDSINLGSGALECKRKRKMPSGVASRPERNCSEKGSSPVLTRHGRTQRTGPRANEIEVETTRNQSTRRERALLISGDSTNVTESLATQHAPSKRQRREVRASHVPSKQSMLPARSQERPALALSGPANEDQPALPALANMFRPVFSHNPIGEAVGILNEGNTCYLNAVIQLLMTDKVFISEIRNRILPGMPVDSVSASLLKMANHSDPSEALKAREIRTAISKQFPEFSSSEQQDAHEFFLRCVDVVAKDCALTSFQDSPTHTRFTLVQERFLRCKSCGHDSGPRIETLRGLSLDIPEQPARNEPHDNLALSVDHLLSNFFATQELDLNCEHCEGKKAVSQTSIALAPRSLLVHVKRFGVVYRAAGDVALEKISDIVRVPDRISLDPFLSSNAVDADKLFGYARKDAFQHGASTAVATVADKEGGEIVFPCSMRSELDHFAAIPEAFDSRSQVIASPATSTRADLVSSGAILTRRDFAQRFRVHAKRPRTSTEVAPFTDDALTRTGRGALSEPGDAIQDDEANSQMPNRKMSYGSEKQLRPLAAMGLPRRDAEMVLEKAGFDETLAARLAIDLRRELRERPRDFDKQLADHISHVRKHSESVECALSDVQCKRTSYRLAAVIRHDSPTVEMGHYVADVHQADGSWRCYNDSEVSRLSSRVSQESSGYLCLYLMD